MFYLILNFHRRRVFDLLKYFYLSGQMSFRGHEVYRFKFVVILTHSERKKISNRGRQFLGVIE